MVYPAIVDAEIFRSRPTLPEILQAVTIPNPFLPEVEKKKPLNQADNDQELKELVGKVLQSSRVISTAAALIARANDVLEEREKAAQAAAPPVRETAPAVTPGDPPPGADAAGSPPTGG